MAYTEELVALAKKHLPRNYAPPDDLVLRKGRKCRQEDVDGNQYFDALACYSAANYGHCHPEIVAAIATQLTELMCNANCFWEEQKILFAAELAEFCNDFGLPGLDMVLPMNSGAEAFDTAVKIARKWAYLNKSVATRPGVEIVVCENNFHGRTIGAISASSVRQYTDLFGPLVPGFKIIPFGNVEALRKAIAFDVLNTAAFVVEPVQGEGGINIPLYGYLTEARKICTDNNILFVLDEIQSGFGRTGKMFACNHENVIPDMTLLGKALGGGIIISAVVGRPNVMDVLEPGDHGSTFGGNPLACAAARASLRIMRRDRLDKRSAELGAYFKTELEKIAAVSPYIKEVRAIGLWVGIEVKDGGPTGHEFCERLRQERILCKETRDYVIRMSPPLIISIEELHFLIEKIHKVFVGPLR